ncbi:MAG: hypothetical protein ACPLRZ_05250 [Thermovenabulum sp.]|uniref:hypothetical protein n=1 Tax=Thermovenabulum sp. TaxID=3100335 RepID=UPI003C7B4C0B
MYDDVKLIIIVFVILLIMFLRFAEKGVMDIMGIYSSPQTFDFKIYGNGNYKIEILGEDLEFNKKIKICDFYTENKNIIISKGGKEYSFSPLINICDLDNATEILSRLIKKISECIIKLTVIIFILILC